MLGSSRRGSVVVAFFILRFGRTRLAGSFLVVNFRPFTATSTTATGTTVVGFPRIFVPSTGGWGFVAGIVRRTSVVVQSGRTTTLHVSWWHCYRYSVLVIRVVVKRFIFSIGRSNISVLRYLFVAFVQVTMIRRFLLTLLGVLFGVLFFSICFPVGRLRDIRRRRNSGLFCRCRFLNRFGLLVIHLWRRLRISRLVPERIN